ncbi:flagellar biosynthesis anti-sigma factor FlgM [Anaerobiospirillum thomasii]|uniref:Negative regulator of flagellin synthesis n=1 Tax=Anaerobiospirillum thomasii TaxID=179995 RepID=A0A2X0WSE4_9GAMM|nr:flagellar biosynthesis anti-sigma factor FlgM [Anaerobiospirillum thomasii]SPT69482.1 flagellar biosynthesis anti-sigma factor FlgM [Anaerobiospirillum thomasii]SPT71963.1 flagellar biosynthesis anti-sigma factor FlgM [Anaerobiospirillum thomasii]
MAIDILRSNIAKAMPETVAGKAASRTNTGAVAKTKDNAATENDAIVLTSDAKVFSSAVAKAKEAEGIDYNKVAALKKEIENGTYKIDYERLASRIVDSEDELNSIF